MSHPVYCRLGSDDGQVMTAHVRWMKQDAVLFDIVTHDGARFTNRYLPKDVFLGRYFAAQSAAPARQISPGIAA